MAPQKKAGARGKDASAPGALMALDADDQTDFERRVADVKKNLSSNPSSSGTNIRGVLYLGHIPHGFFEKEMRSFFSQFGRVTRLRISRSRRTGASKGYGYLEFQHEEVAKVAADTMNNYLMYRQILKCEFMPAEKVHPDTFKHSERAFRAPTAQQKSRQRHNKAKTAEAVEKKAKKRNSKLERKMAALKEMGVDYEFTPEALCTSVDTQPTDEAMSVDVATDTPSASTN